MSTKVARILEQIASLTPGEQVELRRAIEPGAKDAVETGLALHDADRRLVADTWDNLGPAPDVDYDAL